MLGAAADVLVVAPKKLPKALPVEAAAEDAAGMLKLKVPAELDAAALEAPNNEGFGCGVPKAGVLGVPKGDGVAPKAGVELAPNRDGVLAAGVPKAGVLAAPNAGVLAAPKVLGFEAAGWPKPKPLDDCPNGAGVCAAVVCHKQCVLA